LKESETSSLSLEEQASMADLIEGGDEAAWARAYELYHECIFRFCAGYVRCKEEADDLVQEIFIKLRGRISQFQRGRSLRSWLYGIARNACLDQMKKKRLPRWRETLSSRLGENEPPSPTRSPLTKLVQKEQRQKLEEALDELDELSRAALVLKHMEGLNRSEIAEILGVDETQVKNLLFRSMKKLRKNFEIG